MIRNIIKIDEEKCNGCGLCVPACAEGALQIVDGKARLVSDVFCDGLGACIGECPAGALTIEAREAEEFDEKAVMAHARTEHTHAHAVHTHACPSAEVMTLKQDAEKETPAKVNTPRSSSMLSQWPIQLLLVPPNAPFLKDSDLLIAADCVAFSYGDFHQDLLKGRKLIIGCPKLDDAAFYRKKLESMFREGQPRSITVANMEVPCCFGLHMLVKEALASSGRNIPLKQEIISVQGDRLNTHQE